MDHLSWQRPLSPEFVLGGEMRLTRPLLDPTQSWVVAGSAEPAAAPGVKSRIANRPGEITLQAQYHEDPLESQPPGKYPLPPILDQMAWDWIEYHYQPFQDLEVEVINWVPDPRVICGWHRIRNAGSQPREITLKLTCQDEMGSRGVRLSKQTYQGRKILSGSSTDQSLVLFLSGSRALPSELSNQLAATAYLEPAGTTEIRWILICCDSDGEIFPDLQSIIMLDWEGEIARRKIALSGQLEIRTGNAEWDFSLAFSQRQARLLLNQLTLQLENPASAAPSLDPLKAWQLYLALTPHDPANLGLLIQTAFRGKGDQGPAFPIEAELLWQAQQAGLPPDLMRGLLPIVETNLQGWFSKRNDKDQDGIPEEPGEDIFLVADYHLEKDSAGMDPPRDHEYLETPGLAALLHNEISQLEKLQENFAAPWTFPELSRRKRELKAFILSSWQQEKGRFQARDYQTHLNESGYALPEPIQNGWNILRTKLPYPSRLNLQIPLAPEAHPPRDLQVTFLGADWHGRYRNEDLTFQDILRQENHGWATTETIFSRLDYCVVKGLDDRQKIYLLAHRSDKQDLSLTLPLWLEGLAGEIGENTVTRSLDGFWSAYGLQTCPLPANSPVNLPLNLLICQGLIRTGHNQLAGDLFSRWMEAITRNLAQTGRLYSSWDSKTGARRGKGNHLESSLPIVLLLDLLGVKFQGNKKLILEESGPFLFPLQLIYRGTRITLEEDETVLHQPGREPLSLPRGKKAVIQLYGSRSEIFST